jgi:hypothetical protein
MRLRLEDVGRASRHGGATLVEVLVAIFVMAIGMITLLTLFPLGLLSMAQAIKDDRTGTAAANATAIDKIWNIRFADNLANNLATTFYWNLNAGWFQTPPSITYPSLPAITAGNSGYPIYVDPFGINSSYGNTVGALTIAGWPNAPGFPRVDISSTSGLVSSTAWRTSWFTLLDDLEFENNGVPADGNPTAANNIKRDDRYTWAYLLRMPNVSNPQQVWLTVVVYSGRTQLPSEQAFQARWLSASGNVVRLYWDPAAIRPPIRKGGWVLEPTLIAPPSLPPNTNGVFYRVVNTTDASSDIPGKLAVDLELQSNRHGITSGTDSGASVMVILEGVVEVFERGF